MPHLGPLLRHLPQEIFSDTSGHIQRYFSFLDFTIIYHSQRWHRGYCPLLFSGAFVHSHSRISRRTAFSLAMYVHSPLRLPLLWRFQFALSRRKSPREPGEMPRCRHHDCHDFVIILLSLFRFLAYMLFYSLHEKMIVVSKIEAMWLIRYFSFLEPSLATRVRASLDLQTRKSLQCKNNHFSAVLGLMPHRKYFQIPTALFPSAIYILSPFSPSIQSVTTIYFSHYTQSRKIYR